MFRSVLLYVYVYAYRYVHAAGITEKSSLPPIKLGALPTALDVPSSHARMAHDDIGAGLDKLLDGMQIVWGSVTCVYM